MYAANESHSQQVRHPVEVFLIFDLSHACQYRYLDIGTQMYTVAGAEDNGKSMYTENGKVFWF